MMDFYKNLVPKNTDQRIQLLNSYIIQILYATNCVSKMHICESQFGRYMKMSLFFME
jgi:hypothetical protein